MGKVTIEMHDEDDLTVSPLGASSPPYSSHAAFQRLLDSLRDNGLPARLDRS